jgi:beta-glucanase (GH16 family)
MIVLKLVSVLFLAISVNSQCRRSVTTVIGTKKPSQICSGELIFEDNFDELDKSTWKFENNMGGGGNKEHQWYTQDSRNAFTKNGHLHIAPTTTASMCGGESYLTSAHVTIPASKCTWPEDNGCDKQGTPDNIINPIRSARIDTQNSFSFKYGTLEIRAKMPAGDWLWPAMWLLPKNMVYGGSIRSGEIDLTEIRGNLKLTTQMGGNVGVEQQASTLHFGPKPDLNGASTASYTKNFSPGLNADFHDYKLKWTPSQMIFSVDDEVYGTVNAGTVFGFYKITKIIIVEHV